MAKSLHKWIIGIIIGSTVAGVAKIASSEKGKEKIKTRKDKALDTAQGLLNFIQGGIEELKKQSGSANKKIGK